MEESRLNTQLRSLAAPFLERIASATVEDMRARYDFGAAMGALRDVSGARGILEDLAATLDVDASALRRIARTHEVISAEEFEWLTQLRTPSGKALAWSQVEILTRERNTRRRRQLAMAIAREDLSVRDLVKRMMRRG
jgi:hypothetical protein